MNKGSFHAENTGWAKKKYANFKSAISLEPLKLELLKSRHIEVHSILFRIMHGFMGIRAIEMVEMAFRKKSTLQKTCRMHARFQSS